MTYVVINDNESFETSLKRFKKLCEKAGILSEVYRREYYEKPSIKRKRKSIAARKRVVRREKQRQRRLQSRSYGS